MKILNQEFLESIYKEQREVSLFGKWITFNNIKKLFSKYNTVFQVSEIGTSEENRPIMQFKIGSGKKKNFMAES
mgnify:FL=1